MPGGALTFSGSSFTSGHDDHVDVALGGATIEGQLAIVWVGGGIQSSGTPDGWTLLSSGSGAGEIFIYAYAKILDTVGVASMRVDFFAIGYYAAGSTVFTLGQIAGATAIQAGYPGSSPQTPVTGSFPQAGDTAVLFGANIGAAPASVNTISRGDQLGVVSAEHISANLNFEEDIGAGAYSANFTFSHINPFGVAAGITIVTPSLYVDCNDPPPGRVGTAYSHAFLAFLGVPPYHDWEIADDGGGLPPGLSLNAATGEVSGTPTSAGIYWFFISVEDTPGVLPAPQPPARRGLGCSIRILPPPLSIAGAWLIINEPSLGLTDRSSYLDENNPASFTLQQRSRSTATIGLVVHKGDSYAATLGSPVYLFEFIQGVTDGICVFAGTIDTIEKTWDGDRGDNRETLNCVSLEQSLDVILVPTVSHFGQTCGFIVQWLLDNYAPDAPFTIDTIEAGPVLPIFTIDFDRISDSLDTLAGLADKIWGIDPADQTFFFKDAPTIVSPYTLASQNVLWETMDWQQNRQDFRDKQSLRIAFEAFFPQYVSFAGNGSQAIFTLPFRIDHLTFTALTTSTQNTGTGTFTANPADGDTIQASTEIYTFVAALDNTVQYQVLIGAAATDTLQNFIDAINGNPAPGIQGVTYSLPTWANAALTADAPSGLTLTVRSGYAGAGSNPLASSSSAFAWTAATTEGGVTGSSAPLTFVVASADAALSDVYYTVGNENVNCRVPPPAGKNLLVGYYRQGADVISVEDNALVTVRAAIEHSTGRYQQITSDTEQRDALAALAQVQGTLAAYKALPVTFQFTTDWPGLSIGQNLSITLTSPTGTPSLINGGSPYLIQEVNGELVPGIQYIGPSRGHFRYTVHVISATIGTYVDFWKSLGSGGSGAGSGAGGAAGGGAGGSTGNFVVTDGSAKTPGHIAVWDAVLNEIVDGGAAIVPGTPGAPGLILEAGYVLSSEGFITLEDSSTAVWAPNGTLAGAHAAVTETYDMAGLATTDAPDVSGSGTASEYYDLTLDAVMLSTNGSPWAALRGALVEETPSGTKNSVNLIFTLTYTPSSASLALFLNGVFQRPAVDYTLSTATITYTVAPRSTDTHTARYTH